MHNKNVNFANITTGSGNVQLGDNYVVNIISGLGELLSEYKMHLDTIELFINQFRVITALGLLNELEQRVDSSTLTDKQIIQSKLFYLKACCKQESSEYTRQDVATDFIRSYKLNPSDFNFKERACVEYLNLDDRDRALALADEILQFSEYNRTAWYVKAICADSLETFINTVPKIVFEEYNFQMAMASHVITSYNIPYFEGLQKFGLRAEIAFEKYTKVKFSALEAWRQAIDMGINKFFNEFPLRYINGAKFIFKDNVYLQPVFDLISTFVQTLEHTEIAPALAHQKFFYGYFGYLTTNEKQYLDIIESLFPDLEENGWVFTFCYCQLLNHNENYGKSMELVNSYLSREKESLSEAYLLKTMLLHLTGKDELIEELFTAYLSVIPEIEEKNGFNIVNTFARVIYGRFDEMTIKNHIDAIDQKSFKDNAIRSVMNITLSVRYLRDFDNEEVYSRLVPLMDIVDLDINWKELIAENLNSIGKRAAAIHYMETFVDKNVISESLRLYTFLLYHQLTDKYDETTERSEDVLELLKFWRYNSKLPDREFLLFEHNLYTEINDLDSLEAIDGMLYEQYPEDEQFLLIYLNVLERAGRLEKMSEVAKNIKEDFDNESFGVNISSILIRSKAEVKKGFTILFKLASHRNNTIARRNYFTLSLTLKGFLEAYPVVSKGNWVSYKAEDVLHSVKIEKDSGLQKELLGRKVNEVFTIPTGMGTRTIEIKVLEILNDAFHLLRDIQEEMSNPANDLGFESFQIPTDPSQFFEFLKTNFGSQGSQEKSQIDKLLDDYFNYRIGLTEVTGAVFKRSYIDAYLHLTGVVGNKFTTLPGKVTKPILKGGEKTIYALDFSTVLLFFFLERDLGFEFVHKYCISFYIKDEIQRELMLLETTPFSPMTLQVTERAINRYENPEDYHERRRQFLTSILQWIESHCEVDLIPEKLNLLAKFDQNERLDDFMKILVDYMCLCDRQNYQVVSSDSTLFLCTRRNNTIGNIIDPEKYLKNYYPDKCDSVFYRYLLQNNYLGIIITLDTLKNEFYQMLAGSQTFYYFCLENLQFTIHANEGIIITIGKFLKELYLMKSLTIEAKNSYAHELLSHAVIGMPRGTVMAFGNHLQKEFWLLGNLSEELRKTFLSVFKK